MKHIQTDTPKILLLVSIIVSTLVFLFIKPIAQDIHYHQFANDTTILEIHNFWNVTSNLSIILVGLYGYKHTLHNKIKDPMVFALIIGIILTGAGSAYYHYNPSHTSLIWDRLPMTIVFTTFFGKIYVCYFNKQTSYKIWLFSLISGIISVFYWNYTESIGQGDLRLYAIVQFLPMLLIPIIVIIHHSENKYIWKPLSLIFVWYILAKLLEYYDQTLYAMTNCVSGHPIKHICAAIACYYIIAMTKETIVHKTIKR
jgi:hypothetical protein